MYKMCDRSQDKFLTALVVVTYKNVLSFINSELKRLKKKWCFLAKLNYVLFQSDKRLILSDSFHTCNRRLLRVLRSV